jgi:hypothetical protein
MRRKQVEEFRALMAKTREEDGRDGPMKVTITATQRGLTPRQRRSAEARLEELRPEAIIHGGCLGGDDELI